MCNVPQVARDQDYHQIWQAGFIIIFPGFSLVLMGSVINTNNFVTEDFTAVKTFAG